MERCRYRCPASSPHLGVFATDHEAYPRHDDIDVEAKKLFCLQVRRGQCLFLCLPELGVLAFFRAVPPYTLNNDD